jgi:hypothetical protein
MPDEPLVDMVNALMGSRRPNDPPLVMDFRYGRLAFEKRQFEKDLSGAARTMREPARFQGLRAYLAKEFPGCKSLNEAVEVRKLQIKIAKASDPYYDPMTDEKWTGT